MCNSYNSEIDRWQEEPPLNEARGLHSSCALGIKIYIFEGWHSDAHNRIDTVEVLDTAEERIFNEKGEDVGRTWQLLDI